MCDCYFHWWYEAKIPFPAPSGVNTSHEGAVGDLTPLCHVLSYHLSRMCDCYFRWWHEAKIPFPAPSGVNTSHEVAVGDLTLLCHVLSYHLSRMCDCYFRWWHEAKIPFPAPSGTQESHQDLIEQNILGGQDVRIHGLNSCDSMNSADWDPSHHHERIRDCPLCRDCRLLIYTCNIIYYLGRWGGNDLATDSNSWQWLEWLVWDSLC